MLIDEKIEKLLVELNRKKELLTRENNIKKQSWKTNCSLALNGKPAVNIQTATEEVLIELVSSLIQFKNAKEQTCSILELDYNDKIGAYSYQDWLDDCRKRSAIIKVNKEEILIKTLETRINSILSPDKKRELELESIEKDFSNLR